MEDSNLKTLYNSLRRDNYDVPDNYDSFERTLTNDKEARRTLYNSLRRDNYDVPDNYDSFDRTLFPAPSAAVQQAAASGEGDGSVGKLGTDPNSTILGKGIGASQGGALGGALGALQVDGAQEGVTNTAPEPEPVIEPQQPTDVKQKFRPAELTEKEAGDDLAFMREVNRSQGDIPEDDQDSKNYWMPHYDKNWKAGYSQSWGKIKGLFDGLDYGKKDVTSSLDAAVKSRYDGMSDQELESELQKLSKEYKAGKWEGVEDSLRAHIQRLQMNLIAHEYNYKNFEDMSSHRGEAEYEMYKYHPAFDQEWLATYKGGPGENPLVNMGKEIVKKQLIEDTMNGVPRDEGYYQSLPFRDKEFSKRYASWALKRAKVLGNQGFADVWDSGIKEWEAYIGAGLLESGAAEAMAQGAGYGDVGIAGGKYNADYDAAAATAWGMAEDEYRRLSGAHSDEIWGGYASMGGGREARMVASGEWMVSSMADRLSSHDLDKMIDNAWKALGESKQKQIILAAAQNLKQQYPGMSPAEIVKTAQVMAGQQTVQRVLDYAKKQHAPKNVIDYFVRKVIEQNSIFKIQEAVARSRAGTTGDWQAREMAMQEYGKNHRIAGIAGTVVGMGLDPVTYISAGVGKGAATGTVKLIEKLGGAAGRKWLTTTAGKVVVGAAGGAANLGTFEGLNETLNQLRWGGSPAVDLKTGLIKTAGYDAGEIGKAIFHGSTMGAGTGIVAPLVGNVWSPLMDATSSTAGKMAVKTGELFTGTIAEGTIFSIPDIYNAYTESEDIIKSFSDKKSRNYIGDEQERAKAIAKVRESRNETMLDTWSESVATMAGFKMKHVGQRLYELSQSGNGRAGFETRLRYMLDRKPDLALTKDEQAELERGGYADLKELVDEYVEAEKNRRVGSKPVVTGKPRPLELGTREEDMPYNRFVDLMNDGSISEAARAKMYYYITGHALPMSTVMYGHMAENKDRDGNVKSYTVRSIGANGVVTSREFTSRKRAENELQKVNRQIELNTIDIGERYNEEVADKKRFDAACRAFAAENNLPVSVVYERLSEGLEKRGSYYEQIAKIYKDMGDAYSTKQVRAEVEKRYNVDIQKIIKKEPNRRSDVEQMALDEYVRRLFPEKEATEGDAEDVSSGDATSDTDGGDAAGGVGSITDESDAVIVETLSRTGEDGMIHPAVLKGEDEAGVDIVSGNVVTLADGTIDVAGSDPDIVVVDVNGERQMVSINDIASVGEVVDPNAVVDAAMQAQQGMAQEEAKGDVSATGVAQYETAPTKDGMAEVSPSSLEVGGRYDVTDEQGVGHQVEVLRDYGNGTVEVRVDGAEDSMPMVKAQLEAMLGIEPAQPGEPPMADTPPGDVPADAGTTLTPPTPEAPAAPIDPNKPQLGERAFPEHRPTIPDTKPEDMSDEAIAAEIAAIRAYDSDERTQEMDRSLIARRNALLAEQQQRAEEAIHRYRFDENADVVAMGQAGFSVNEVRYVVDYLNGKLNERELLNALGFYNTDTLTDEQIESWVDSVVERAGEFITDAEESGVNEQSSDRADNAGTTETPPTTEPGATTALATEEVADEVEAMPMLEDGNPDYSQVDASRAHDYLYSDESGLDKSEADEYVQAQIDAAEKALSKIDKKPLKMGTDLAKYRAEKQRRQEQLDAAKANVDYWERVKAIEADREAQTAAERKAKDAEVIAQAQAEEEARQAAEVAKQREQAERGAGAVHPAIAEKWDNAPKIEGYKDEVVLANGERVPGTYYLVESGAVTPSHNASREFEKYEGFPVDENGNTINDRDYERDKDAQKITRSIADKYDSRALQSPVIVSKDGVVLSGNGRTMAGELAASNNTDGAYIEHLKNYGRKYGFSPEQVSSMQHPRAVFVPDTEMPYTTETFAKFNAQEMKGQSKTEQAVKLGKVVDDATFNQIVRAINDHETLGDFYNNTRAATEAINALRRAGAINDMQYAEMFDGDAVSDRGRQIIENMLIGKAFEGNPDVIRMLTEYKGFRQSVVTALNEISTNVALGKDYSLENELAQAIELAYKARKAGFKENELVSPYATQLNLFPFEDGETVADYNNAAVLLLADMLNDKRPTLLKKKLQDYNQQSAESAAGQMDIFSGGVKDKKEIIKTVLNTLHNGEREETQRPEQRGPVADERGGEASLQEDGAAGQPEQGESNIQGLESYSEDELRVIVEEHVRSAIADADMDAAITGIRFIGSRTTGTARADSDLDVLVEYQGTASEDSLFNVLNDEDNRLVIDGITVDINPITPGKSGTIEEFMRRNAGYKKETAVQEQIALAEQQTETSPSEAQKEAGNYKKGHVKIDGFDISIEQPKGSVRNGVDASGKSWRQKMNNTYGYIRGTEGVDGDHIDVFLSDDIDGWNGTVYVVDQVNNDGSFDEHKVMYGFNSEEEARQAYLSNYEDGWQGLGAITAVSKDEFKKWIGSSHRKTKPFAEYKNVKVEGEQAAALRQPTGQKVDVDIARFHKETDSSGRTAIDEANYNADDLVAPLLVDGKKSHIGITLIVPDDINEPTYTRAYYDYAHLIDPKSNKGWQVVGDKVDEWNASHKKDEQGFDDGDAPQVRFPSVDAALKFTEWFEGATHPVSTAKSSQKSEVAEAPKERIDDVGEKIEGAKKDLAQKMGERINLDADTFPKMFPKYDLKKLISQGLDPSLAVMTKMLRQMAQADYKHYSKKRMYGKSYALRAARFYAAYAKQVLEAGDSNVDFKSEGLGFTDYGKQFIELNKRLFEELHKKLGDDIFDLDLTGVKMQPISQKEGTTWYRRNQETGESEPYNPAYAFIGPRGQSYYEANELDKALQEGVEQVSKSIDYKKTHPYKLGHYYKPGVKNSDYVGVKLGGKVVPLTEPMTSSEVRKYISEHNAELQAKAAQLDEQRKLDKKGGTGEGRWKPELTLGGGRPRVGADRRGGVDIEAEEFMKSFGFRGVQFGNYVTQRERQCFLNEAYDALMDMAELLGISPRALAIDGRLGLAIGARGGGKANAHYEPKENVINLTKSKGAGSLAHEWFHALDYYFNKSSNRPTSATSNKSAEQFPASTRDEMRKAFLDLMRAIKDSDYYNRSVALEQKLHPQQQGEGYYDKPTELGARAFQDYVVRKLTDQGKINDFLSSFTSEKDWNGEPENYPYPVGAEAEKIDEKFDALFDAMQERTDEEGNTILYHLGKYNEVLTDTEVALRDGLVEVLRGAGIEVVTDEAEGQRVLDAANRAADVLDEMKKRNQQQETALPEDESSFKGTAISSADGAKIIKNLESGKKASNQIPQRPNGDTPESARSNDSDANLLAKIQKVADKASVEDEKTGADGEVSTHSDATQANPTFSREDLGAVLSDAKIQQIVDTSKDLPENSQYFRTGSGEVYGFVRDGKIYIDPRVASAETPVHEYSHLWADALKRANPEAWERLKETMLGEKDVLEHVKRLYPELEGDELLAEVFSHYSGKRGAERLRADMEREVKNAEGVFAKARVAVVFDKIRRALSRFWQMARDLFAGKNSMLNGMSAEDFADMAMADMLRGFDPRGVEKEIALNETHYHKVTDKAELERLNNEPTVVRYRAMQMIDGKLYPPMSAEVKGELREPTEIGVWERSDERPDLVDKNGKFKLQKGKRFKENKEGQGDTPAAYNPYFHTSTSMMNDQFTAAYVRPELVVVKVEIPESELSSGYKAEKAKDAVGNIPWHSGPVNSALPKERQRTVTLSRYCKVTGVVPDAEVADAIARQLDGLDVAVPYNVVTPNVRAELEARGVKISVTPSGSVTRDINGELINRGEAMVANEGEVLYEPMARNTGRDIEIVNSRFNEELQKQINGTLPKGHVYKLGKPSAILRSAGIPELPIELVASRLVDKSMQENHPYDLSEVEDLPQSIHTPLAVFRSATHTGSYVILTELRHGNRNFVAAIETNRQLGKLLVNSIRSVHPRNGMNVVNWINEGLAEYVHPEFEGKWLTPFKNELRSKPQYNSADVRTQLKDAAKIVKDFENPSIGAEKVTREHGSSYRSGSGDVIRFESHAEQLSLFGTPQSGALRQHDISGKPTARGERVKRASEMSDAELLSEMGRDIAELEKAGRADWGVQTLYSEEYDRRHVKEYNEECDRVRTMLDENNVGIEEAEQMLLDTIFTWREGFATADRSRLLAQFDTLNDYYAEKEDERDNSDLYKEAEAEQAETPAMPQEVAFPTQQTEPAKPTKTGFDPSAIKLRKLKGGETCYVERRYQESGSFDFTGSEKVESDADLAYIFRNLENSAIENTFLVLIKNGKATILHVGMGGYAFSAGHLGAGVLAASQLRPDSVIFVHNHPSGTLKPSQQDVAMQEKVKKMFGADKVREAIIIDITSGKYSIFDIDGSDIEKQRPTSAENEVPYKTYSFSQQVFAEGFVPDSTFQITDSDKAAEFISGHRLGERDKLSLIVLNRQKRVTGNIFLPWTTLDDIDINKAAGVIAKFIHQMGGESGILYGSGTISRGTLSPLARAISNYEVHLDDFISVEGKSAFQAGAMEEGVEYQTTAGNIGLANEDSVPYDDSGISDEELAGYDAGRYSLAESITQGLVELAAKNADDQQLRMNAMRKFGGNLSKLQRLMSKQRAYDKATVDDIVRLTRMVMGNGFFKDMRASEVKRLLAAIKKGVGVEDLTPIANNVVDMLVQHQLRESKNILHKLMQVRGRKVDARGVEVQAGLDIDGQRMMSALKDGMSLSEDGLSTRINDCENRLGSEDEVIRKNAMSEYQGLMLAKEYHDNILSGEEEEIVLRQEKRQEQEKIYDFRREPVLDQDGNAIMNLDGSVRTIERKTLKPEFKGAMTDENKRLRRNTEAAIERIEQSIRENRMERVTAYSDFMSDVAGDVRASRERAAAWRAEQQERIDAIHHNANSDLEGVPVQSQTKMPEGGLLAFNSNNDIVRLLFQPLATFEKMLRFFGRKAHNGEGYLFNRFMRGWADCSDKEWRSKRAAHEELDAKVRELFGKKAKRWSDLYEIERNKKHPGIPVEYWDNGERVRETMSQGEALSLVVWSKQKDAEAGLRRMGISEEDIETIKSHLDPKFLELANWVVEEFLPKRRTYYNEVHERMFGAPMAAIEHYFPIVRNSRDVEKPSDITERDLGETKPSTITGNIIKRQRTAAALDVHTDFFDHLLKHLDDMENWAAWAEFNRDINTLRNYKRFKNRVLNMHSVEFGSGKDLWKAFDDACAIAAGVYHPSTKRGSGDNLAVNIAKGVTGAKIAFRFYTAAKQLLSLPAFWNGDASLLELAKWENPAGAIIAWNWAMKNLPGFSKRWQSRQVGDVRLMDTDSDYAFWRNNMVRALSRGGMWANALVDGMTVAMGARAVYETKKKRYLRNGYSEEQAEKRAMQDAAINYNSSQQSSENAFLSSLQLDRTWWSTLMTVFRSASMGYQRRLTTGLRNLKNRMNKGYKAESIEFMKKQMVRDGIDEATAEKAARRMYRWGGIRSMADVFVFGLVLPFFWNLGPYALYLLMGDDDDDKKDMLKDAAVHSLFGPVEGLTGGQAMSEIGNTWAGYAMSDNDKSLLNALRYHDYLSMPLGSDLQQIFNDTNSMAAWTDAFNLLVQAGIGVNPETFTDAWVAIADACDGDPQTTKEFALCFMRVMQVPQTQIDKLFIDELGMTARDAQKLNAMEMADRYARYKKFRNAPLLNWAYSPDESQEVAKKYRNRFLDNMQERMERLDDEQLEWNFVEGDPARKKAVTKTYFKARGIKDGYSSGSSGEYAHIYSDSRLYSDMAEDALLQLAKTQAENRGDKEQLKAIDYIKSEILTPVLSGEKTGVGQMKAETLEKLGRYAVLTEKLRNEKRRRENAEGLKGMTGDKDSDEKVLRLYRELRKELLRELGVI